MRHMTRGRRRRRYHDHPGNPRLRFQRVVDERRRRERGTWAAVLRGLRALRPAFRAYALRMQRAADAIGKFGRLLAERQAAEREGRVSDLARAAKLMTPIGVGIPASVRLAIEEGVQEQRELQRVEAATRASLERAGIDKTPVVDGEVPAARGYGPAIGPGYGGAGGGGKTRDLAEWAREQAARDYRIAGEGVTPSMRAKARRILGLPRRRGR